MVNRIDTSSDSSGTLTRRKLLALLGGGSVAGFTLGSQTWFRSAFASTEPPGPTIPPPSVPEPALTPPATPSVAETAASLDWDVDRIFRFVADEVAYDPYAGALRGATGTLWGLGGNSVDQALLLAALLREAQVPVRFAMGPLANDSSADKLVGAAALDEAAARKRAAAVLLRSDAAEAWTGEGGWDRVPEVDGILAAVRDRVATSVGAITDALAVAGVELPADDELPALPDRERTQHVWVQYADGPNWVDLDPSVPEAEPGTAYSDVAETLDALPDDLFHTVTIRVIAEVVTGGVPTPTEVLSHRVRSADVAGVGLVLVHPNAEWLGIAEAITGQQKHVPTLLVGDLESVKGTTMTLQEGEGVLDVLGEEGTTEGQALAEWIEYEISSPDRPVTTAVRGVFDRIDVEQRTSGTIDLADLPPIEQVDAGEELGTFYAPLAGAIMISVAGMSVPWQQVAVDAATSDEVTVSASIAHGFHYLRDAVRLDQLADAAGRLFADEPNVAAVSISTQRVDDMGLATVGTDIDIIHAHHSFAAFPGRQATVPSGLLSGAIDHAAERMVFEDSLRAGFSGQSEAAFVSVGRVFEAAAAAGIATIAVLPDGSTPMPQIEPAAALLVQRALAAGKIVVIPERSVEVDGQPRSGWWEVDPASGATADRLDNGRGSVLVEFAELLHWLFLYTACIFALGTAIAGIAGWVSGDAAAAAGAAGAGLCIAAFATGPAVLAPFLL